MTEGETSRPSDPFVPLKFHGSVALGRQLGRHETDEQVRLKCPRPRHVGDQPQVGSGAMRRGGLGRAEGLRVEGARRPRVGEAREHCRE